VLSTSQASGFAVNWGGIRGPKTQHRWFRFSRTVFETERKRKEYGRLLASVPDLLRRGVWREE